MASEEREEREERDGEKGEVVLKQIVLDKEQHALWQEASVEVDAAYALHDSYSAEHKLQLQRHTSRAHALLDMLKPRSMRERAQLAYLRGKVLDASHAYSAEAEELLTRAVKLDPMNIDAWNTLAECLWKGGRLELAHSCLREALAIRPNTDSLCQLSMLMRTMSNSANAADSALVLESLQLAKEAVALDVSCGRSWYVLGNAYLSSYFAATLRLDDLRSALKAYKRATSTPCRPQANCADLHYNKGIVLQYLLEYDASVDAFALAQRLGPELNAAAQRHALLSFGSKCAESVRLRGHLPKKRLQQLERALRASPEPPPAAASIAGRALTTATVSSLVDGPNPSSCLSAAVVAELVPAAQTPLSYVLLDQTGEAILLCVYNTVPSAIQVYQTVSVLAPHKRSIRLPIDESAGGGTDLLIDCVVIEDPVTQLLVQGKALERAHVGRARVTSAGTAPPHSKTGALPD